MSALFAPALAAAVRVDQLLAWSRRRARYGVAVASLVCLVAVYLAFDLSAPTWAAEWLSPVSMRSPRRWVRSAWRRPSSWRGTQIARPSHLAALPPTDSATAFPRWTRPTPLSWSRPSSRLRRGCLISSWREMGADHQRRCARGARAWKEWNIHTPFLRQDGLVGPRDYGCRIACSCGVVGVRLTLPQARLADLSPETAARRPSSDRAARWLRVRSDQVDPPE